MNIQYVVGMEQPPTGHSLGVNSLVQSPEGVYSGGRDGRINLWDSNLNTIRAIDAHVDWVNSLQIVNGLVWSASSDTTIKISDFSTGTIQTVGHHSDFAKCLARDSQPWTVSGGFDGKIIGWADGETRESFSWQNKGQMGSIYSLAAHGNCIASGSPDSVIRLWDPRAKEQQSVLSGHTDNIRSLLMVDGWLLSASSDATVRLWNLVSGRLFRTYTHHSDSVWSLFSDDNLESFYSGDREGKVFHTTQNCESRLVCEAHNVNSMLIREDKLWTAGHNIDIWEGPNVVQQATPHTSLVKHVLLNDKRRALVAASDGYMAMIDIVLSKVLERKMGPLDTSQSFEGQLQEAAQPYNTRDVLDNWCQVSIRAGQLVVSFSERSAGNTEIYADEISSNVNVNLGNFDDDKRVNLGKWTLQNIFQSFAHEEQGRIRKHIAHKPKKEKEKEKDDADNSTESAPSKEKKKRRFFGRMFSRSSKTEEETPEPPEPVTETKEFEVPATFTLLEDKMIADNIDPENFDLPISQFPSDTRVLLSQIDPGAGAATEVFECNICDIPKHNEEIRELLPGWVGEVLLLNKIQTRAPTKIGFTVAPYNAGDAEVVRENGRLLAIPILRSKKIMQYVVSSLKDSGVIDEKTADNSNAEDIISLYCQDQELDPTDTLGVIRTRIWRSGGDVVLKYKLKTRTPNGTL